MLYLDDTDMRLIAKRRGEHMCLGFALQLTMVRYLGTFLTDPLDVSPLVTEHLAGQLRIGDRDARRGIPSGGSRRWSTGMRSRPRAGCGSSPRGCARAWNTGDGPKTIFADGVKWLRENAVLLPGVTDGRAAGVPGSRPSMSCTRRWPACRARTWRRGLRAW
jgi:hypothetical protein